MFRAGMTGSKDAKALPVPGPKLAGERVRESQTVTSWTLSWNVSGPLSDKVTWLLKITTELMLVFEQRMY